jgi:hypothetical protein
MSRAGDPNYHTHVLVQNAARGPDGRWSALDSDRLYAHLMAADHLYLAAERAALTERLGVRWGPIDARSGAAEIVGLDDRALIERFSKRSEEIDDWLAEHGLSGIKASSAAAVATRAPKDRSESEESVYARWARELADAGIGERELGQALTGGCGRLATREEVTRALTELAGPDGLTASASTFTRADVVDALAKRLPVAPSAQQALTQAEQVAERFLGERSVLIGRDARLGVERYSTPELLEQERRLVAAATERRDERCGQVRPEVVRSVLDRHATAGADQAAMVEDVCRSGAGVSLVVGRAGSGKTWALGLALEALELDGYRVLGAAPTGIATVGLGDEGFGDVRTVDRLLYDVGKGRLELDDKTVLVVDEAAMLGTRKLAPLLDHAHHARAKVILVGDDRQFASIDAGGGFRALRVRLGASELTVNRRQVQAWEQQAIDDVRDGRVEAAIAAYAEHERIRAFDGRDDRDRAIVTDWWASHQAGEQPVVYAHRRAQVDRLNTICQRLRAHHGQLGSERLAVGDRTFAVGDRVVLGANALDRLGVANGTSAEITALDVPGRTMTVRTLEDNPPRTVVLPGWYLDAAVRPGQSRRVDLAYARTDMRSQGRTEQRALLALDGKEDMQGSYVQLTRGKERTDLYLTVGPEPLDEGHGHPRGEPVEPARLLGRVLARDASKTLATDTPVVAEVRRWSTRRLREERDQLAALRRECPPDRSRELRLARQRAAELEQARQAATVEHQAATQGLAAVAGSVWRRREAAAARERLTVAEHAVRPPAGRPGRPPSGPGGCAGPSRPAPAGTSSTPTSPPASAWSPGSWPGGAGSTPGRWRWTRRAGCWPRWARCPPLRRRPSGRRGWPPRWSWTPGGAPTAWTTSSRHRRSGGGGTGRRGLGGPLTVSGQRRPRARPVPSPARSPPTSHAPPRNRGGTACAGATPPATAPGGPSRPLGRRATQRPPSCSAPSPAATSPAAAATGSRPAPHSSAWPPTANAPATPTTAPTGTAPREIQRHTNATPGSTPAGGARHAPPHPLRPRRPRA